jgi:transcriptional regulator GlxA family with amidase domain
MGTIGLYLFDAAEELDVVGPYEVLAAWTRMWPEDGWRIVVFADEPGEVQLALGLRMIAEHGRAGIGPLDVLVYPGGDGTRRHLRDEAHLAWLRGVHDRGALMASVCTGALVFAAAGLLAGRPATTYHGEMAALGELDTSIELRPNDRFVDSGDVVTAAGVAAGIDMALHLVRRLAGADRAREVRHLIAYDPEPPV